MKSLLTGSPRQFALLSAGIALILALSLGSLFFLNTRYLKSGEQEKITIGTAPLESSALVYIAQKQGFFADNGLTVSIREYDTGAASTEGLLKGEVDIGLPAEYALVGKAFQKKEIRAIASIDKAEYFYLIARRDRGIINAADLKGKRIGVVTKTIAEYYLGRFLELHGLNVGKVIPVHIGISRSEEAIVDGRIDAIISRPPQMAAIQKRLGANAISWPAQGSQALHAVMIGRNRWLQEHPKTIQLLLRSLMRAQEYLIQFPLDAKAIVREQLRVDDAYIDTVWSQNQFALTLDQSLITAMEDEARWMIESHLTTEEKIPNFRDYTHPEGLRMMKPEAVRIIQ